MLQLAKRLSVVFLSAYAGLAAAEQIDFDARDGFAYSGQSIDSGGYSFLALGRGVLGFLSVDAQSDIVGNGTRRLFSGNHTDIEITRIGGGKFDFLGLGFGGSWIDPGKHSRWADCIEIVGLFEGGSLISRQLDLTAAPASLLHADFSGFTGVKSVLVRPMKSGVNPGNNFEFVLDDIHVAAVPEPESWMLLGAGLAGMAALRRLRRNSQAKA